MCTRSSGFTEEDIVPDDFDDLSDEKTIQILAGHGSRASPFVSRGRAYLDKVQKILIDQEVPRRVESQIMKAEAWKGISSMAKLRRLHIVRMNSRNRYLRFGETICKFVHRVSHKIVRKMAAIKDEDRARVANRIIGAIGALLYPEEHCARTSMRPKRNEMGSSSVNAEEATSASAAYVNQTLVDEEEDMLSNGRSEISVSTFLRAAQKLEAIHSSLHDYIVYKCNLETELMKIVEGFIKVVYFGDYNKLIEMIEKFFLF